MSRTPLVCARGPLRIEVVVGGDAVMLWIGEERPDVNGDPWLRSLDAAVTAEVAECLADMLHAAAHTARVVREMRDQTALPLEAS